MVILALALIAGAAGWRFLETKSPVPAGIRSAVTFPIYYPDAKRLPAGYSLNASSFQKVQDGVVLYSINRDDGQRISMTEEESPGDKVIDDFNKNSIPLHTSVNTALGQANIGAYGQAPNSRTVVSLLVKNGPWLIITAPSNASQSDIKQIIESLKH